MTQEKEVTKGAARRQARIARELDGEPTLKGEPLSDIEIKMLSFMASGLKGRRLQEAMGGSSQTISHHRRRIFDKYGVGDIESALVKYRQTENRPSG